MSAEEGKKAYTVQSAAKTWDVSMDTIRAAIKRGDLIAKYPTSRPVISTAEMEAWFDSLPTEPPA